MVDFSLSVREEGNVVIIEKLQDVDGKLGYYNLAPIVEKTFNIMGLTKYSTVYYSEAEGLDGMT